MSKSTLQINNKQSFVRFLQAAGALYDQCVMHCNKDTNMLDVFVSTESEQVIMYSEYTNAICSDTFTMNIPDLKKLIKLISYIPAETFTLTINNNSISYNTPELSFKFHLYEDGIIRVKQINKDMLKNFKGEYSFSLSADDIDDLLKSASVLGNVDFVYIKGEQGKIVCEITNKQIPGTDSLTVTMIDTQDTSITFDEIKFSLNDMRLLNSLRCSNMVWQLHTKYNCIVSVSKIDDCIGYYSVTSLV